MFVSICTFLRREDNNFSFYINDITHVFYAVGVVISMIFYRLLFFSFLLERYVAVFFLRDDTLCGIYHRTDVQLFFSCSGCYLKVYF